MNRPDQHDKMMGMLSAYLDGELTQADNQRVRLYLEDNEEARLAFEELRQVQQLTSEIRFPGPSEEFMESLENRMSVRAPLRFGWTLILAGLAALLIYAAVLVIRNPHWPTWPEVFLGAVVVGLVLLFLSVLRQRLLERPHDRYRNVRK